MSLFCDRLTAYACARVIKVLYMGHGALSLMAVCRAVDSMSCSGAPRSRLESWRGRGGVLLLARQRFPLVAFEWDLRDARVARAKSLAGSIQACGGGQSGQRGASRRWAMAMAHAGSPTLAEGSPTLAAQGGCLRCCAHPRLEALVVVGHVRRLLRRLVRVLRVGVLVVGRRHLARLDRRHRHKTAGLVAMRWG